MQTLTLRIVSRFSVLNSGGGGGVPFDGRPGWAETVKAK